MWRILKYFNLIKTNIIFDTLSPQQHRLLIAVFICYCIHKLASCNSITSLCMPNVKPKEDSINIADLTKEVCDKIDAVVTLSKTVAQKNEENCKNYAKCWIRLEQLTDLVITKWNSLIQLHQNAKQIETKNKAPQPSPKKRATRQETRSRSRDVRQPTKKDKLMAQLKKGLKSVQEVAKQLRVGRKVVQKWAKL